MIRDQTVPLPLSPGLASPSLLLTLQSFPQSSSSLSCGCVDARYCLDIFLSVSLINLSQPCPTVHTFIIYTLRTSLYSTLSSPILSHSLHLLSISPFPSVSCLSSPSLSTLIHIPTRTITFSLVCVHPPHVRGDQVHTSQQDLQLTSDKVTNIFIHTNTGGRNPITYTGALPLFVTFTMLYRVEALQITYKIEGNSTKEDWRYNTIGKYSHKRRYLRGSSCPTHTHAHRCLLRIVCHTHDGTPATYIQQLPEREEM